MEKQIFKDKAIVKLIDLKFTKYKCPICKNGYQNKYQLFTHVHNQHGTACHICGKVYGEDKVHRLIKHWRKRACTYEIPDEEKQYLDHPLILDQNKVEYQEAEAKASAQLYADASKADEMNLVEDNNGATNSNSTVIGQHSSHQTTNAAPPHSALPDKQGPNIVTIEQSRVVQQAPSKTEPISVKRTQSKEEYMKPVPPKTQKTSAAKGSGSALAYPAANIAASTSKEQSSYLSKDNQSNTGQHSQTYPGPHSHARYLNPNTQAHHAKTLSRSAPTEQPLGGSRSHGNAANANSSYMTSREIAASSTSKWSSGGSRLVQRNPSSPGTVTCQLCMTIISGNKFSLRTHFYANHLDVIRAKLLEKRQYEQRNMQYKHVPDVKVKESSQLNIACFSCQYQTTDPAQLSVHIATVHPVHLKACDQCDYTSLFDDELEKHQRTYHTQRYY